MGLFTDSKQVDSLVMVQIVAIEDMGAYAKLVCLQSAEAPIKSASHTFMHNASIVATVLIHYLARVRQYRGYDLAFRVIQKTYSIRQQVDPSRAK